MPGTQPLPSIALSMNGTRHDPSAMPDGKTEPNGATKRPPPAPVLPPNMNGMVPMSAIIHRMSNEAFADLSNLSEILPSMDDNQRKLHILDYALSKREQFIKLLVLTKWAKTASKVQQCQNVIGFLQNENSQFAHAVGGLFETYKTFGRARVRNYDIPTAIDVLTTGTYQRLPSRIKQVYVDDDKPSRTEIASTLEKLDDVIRMRILCDELVPPGMKYTIGKGKAKFVVANEFEVSLTVPGPGLPKDVPWRIVGLKILVKPVGGSFQGLESSLTDAQMRAIMRASQKELDVPSATPTPGHLSVPPVDKPLPPANQALLRLYDYLHMLSMHLLIELVYIQTVHLLRSGWTDRLKVEVNSTRTAVRLVYWPNGLTPLRVQPVPMAPAPKRRASTSIAAAAALAKEAAAHAQQEHYLEIKIEPRASRETEIPEGLAGALVDPKALGYPKSQIKVVWSQVVKGVITEDDVASILDLDPSNLNIERLLLKSVNMHAGQVMLGFYDRLWSYIDSKKETLEESEGKHFSKQDIKLETANSGEQPSVTSSTGTSGEPRALLVRIKGDRWVKIKIDVRTGRVVVGEVGKTGEGDDPVITAFQTRLNENASNIVDALISLRFSMAIVELESFGVLLGLQPYRRLALGRQDTAQFGTNIQQIVFLRYPQHPRHYLVVGVIDQKFCVWLIEVKSTDKEVAGIWLTLKSITPVYWEGLKRGRKPIEEFAEENKVLTKRKSVQFNVDSEDEAEEERSIGDDMTIDENVLSKLETLCRVRICHNEAKQQLDEHGIRFRYFSTPSQAAQQPSEPAAHTKSFDLTSMVPLLRLDPSTIAAGTSDDLFLFVGAKLSGWWDCQRETCNFVVQAKFVPGVIPTDMESGPLDPSVSYHSKSNMLSFTYKARGAFIQQFKKDWETMVRMLRVIRQLHAPTLTNPHIRLQTCHLQHVKLEYFGSYTVAIHWQAGQTTEKKSSSGVTIPSAPRFRQGAYKLVFGESDHTKGQVNPHRRMKYFLQDMFNREADLHGLMNTVIQTCSILEVLDVLEGSAAEDGMGMKMISIVPRSAHHVRVVFGSKYAVDIRAYSRTHLSMFDASFPAESYNSSLPPPPAPSTAPSLLIAGAATIPPTTKGHLHYGPIANLQGVIGGIDLDKDEEDFKSMPFTWTSLNVPAGTMTPSKSPKVTAASMHELEVVELLPLPNGVVCSRACSARVLFRLAKHIESLL